MEPDLLLQRMPLSVTVDLPLNIGIPTAYIPDQSLRLRLYRRLADLQLPDEIEPLRLEFYDRFGKLPAEVENLFYQIEVKLLAEKARLASIGVEGSQIVLKFPTTTKDTIDLNLPRLGKNVRIGKSSYWMPKDGKEDWKAHLLSMLRIIIEVRNR